MKQSRSPGSPTSDTVEVGYWLTLGTVAAAAAVVAVLSADTAAAESAVLFADTVEAAVAESAVLSVGIAVAEYAVLFADTAADARGVLFAETVAAVHGVLLAGTAAVAGTGTEGRILSQPERGDRRCQQGHRSYCTGLGLKLFLVGWAGLELHQR